MQQLKMKLLGKRCLLTHITGGPQRWDLSQSQKRNGAFFQFLKWPMPLSPQGRLHWSSLLGLLLDQLPPSSVQSLLFLLQAQLKYHFFKEAFWFPYQTKPSLQKRIIGSIYTSPSWYLTLFFWLFFFQIIHLIYIFPARL